MLFLSFTPIIYNPSQSLPQCSSGCECVDIFDDVTLSTEMAEGEDLQDEAAHVF
jgi:hypothetical protein